MKFQRGLSKTTKHVGGFETLDVIVVVDVLAAILTSDDESLSELKRFKFSRD